MTKEISIPGLAVPEGPRWHRGALWFSDILAGRVYRLSESGEADVVAELDKPSGLGFDSDGKLMVSMVDEARVKSVASGITETVADLAARGADHCNDMFVTEGGRAYVGVFKQGWSVASLMLLESGKTPRVVADQLAFPNGVLITPDGSTLLVAETRGERITAFDVLADGGLSQRRVWAHLPGMHPDGICLDAEGALWVASWLEAEFVRVLEGGDVTQRIPVPDRWAMACALGGNDGRTLYLCSAQTTREEYFAGRSVGHLDAHRVDVPGVARP